MRRKTIQLRYQGKSNQTKIVHFCFGQRNFHRCSPFSSNMLAFLTNLIRAKRKRKPKKLVMKGHSINLFVLHSTAAMMSTAAALDRPRGRKSLVKEAILSRKLNSFVDKDSIKQVAHLTPPFGGTISYYTDRNLQRSQCVTAIDTLFEDTALSQVSDELNDKITPIMDQCTENPCIFNEDDDQFKDLVRKHQDACIEAGGIIYEYDLYLTCTNSAGKLLEDQFFNMDYCYPSAFSCPPTDVEIIANNRFDEYALQIQNNYAEFNYECSYDVDFIKSLTKEELVCRRRTEDFVAANSALDAARDALGSNFWDAYSNCGTDPIDEDCLLDENKLEGAQAYLDECLAAGGRIWEFDMFITCTNSQTNAKKSETILGYDICVAFEGCPVNIGRSIVGHDLRNFAEQLEETFKESGWTCPKSDRRLEMTRFFPEGVAGAFPPTQQTQPTPPGAQDDVTSSSTSLLLFVNVAMGIMVTVANLMTSF